jgi:ankyrin repeat protein
MNTHEVMTEVMSEVTPEKKEAVIEWLNEMCVGDMFYTLARNGAYSMFQALLQQMRLTPEEFVVKGFSIDGDMPLIQRLLYDGLDNYAVELITEVQEVALTQMANGRYLVHEAAYGGHTQVLAKICQLYPSHVPQARCHKGRNVLHWALIAAQEEIATYLLGRYPALASEPDNKGRYPMHIVAATGCLKMVKPLFELCPISINSTDLTDFTPLHTAIYHNDDKMVERLYEYGAFIGKHVTTDGDTLPKGLFETLSKEKRERLFSGQVTPLEFAIMLGTTRCESSIRAILAAQQN